MKFNKKPYVSFVVIGRNDNYCEGFLYRVQRFLDNLIWLCEKYRLNSEILFVEWNPPKNKKRMYEVLKIKKRSYLKIRFIEVPPSIHYSMGGSDKMPIMEALGKNAAIRRANGKFIICTNPDILFNKEIIKFFSKKRLEEGVFYRTERYEMDKIIPYNLKEEKALRFCEKNYQGIFGIPYVKLRPQFNKKFLKKFPRVLIRMIWHWFLINFKSEDFFYMRIHGGAPGDFTLMSKKDWVKIKGYPEMYVQGSIDGYSVVIAYVSGIKMVVLPRKMRIYHQSHEYHGRKLVNFKKYLRDIRYMISNKMPIALNDDNWGLRDSKLKETKF